MEPILQGWLVKSPPEKTHSGSWKMFGAKWRRRYFVLYAPPAAERVQTDSSAAILEYYSTKKLHHKYGTIDLTKCEEVYSALDSAMYKHVFCIQTVHKSRSRTYYLAAETSDEMNKWVNTLCQVLGLTESEETPPMFLPNIIEAKIQQILQPFATVRPVTQIPVRPVPNFSTHPKQLSPELLASRPITLGCPRSGSESNLLDASSSCNSNPRSAGTVPELDLMLPRRGGVQQRDGPPPPLPPDRVLSPANLKNSENSECYDLPPTRIPKVEGTTFEDQDNFYNTPPAQLKVSSSRGGSETSNSVPAVDDDSCYDVPPQKGSDHQGSKKDKSKSVEKATVEELYNVPRNEMDVKVSGKTSNKLGISQEKAIIGHVADSGEEFYNVPNSNAAKSKKLEKTQPNVITNDEELYNVPCEQLQSKGNKVAVQAIEEELYNVPRPAKDKDKAGKPVPLSRTPANIKNLAANDCHEKGQSQSSDLADQTYDLPPTKTTIQKPMLVEEKAGAKKPLVPLLPMQEKMSKLSVNQSVSVDAEDQVYDIPPPGGVHSTKPSPKPAQGRQNAVTVPQSVVEDTYDIPPSKVPPVPAKRNSPAPPKPPRPEQSSVEIRPAAVDVSIGVRADLRGSICGFLVAQSSIDQKEQEFNAASGKTEDASKEMATGLNKTSAFQQKDSFRSAASATPPCIAKKGPPTVEVRDSIRFTPRSKSFKRSLPSQQRSDMPIPIKRIVEHSESSSSEDDD